MSSHQYSRASQEELYWFLQNLETQIEDHKVENSGAKVVFYWDTSTVRNALLGMAAFYDVQSQFRRDEFESRNTLVAGLAAAGWLGTIELLQPHKTELLNLIAMDFGMRDRVLPPGGLFQFLRDVGLDKDNSLGAFGEANPAQIAKIVQEQAGNAEKLFKVVQAIGQTWELRLLSWYESKRIKLSATSEFDIDAALSTPLFNNLRHHFDSMRPGYSINNFADALAICHLQQQLELFKRGTTRILPKFFASSSIFANAANIFTDQDLLTYAVDGKKYSVLCEADYYIFRAAFHPPKKLAARTDVRYSVADLEPLAKELRECVNSTKVLPPEILAELRAYDKSIVEIVRELRQFWFLEHVWLPYAASEEFTDAAKEHVRVARELATNPGFRQRVKQALEAITGLFQRSVSEDNWSRRLFLQLEQNIAGKREEQLAAGGEAIDIFRVFGLLRFGIPAVMQPRVQEVFQLFLARDKSTEFAALGLVVNSFRNGLRRSGTSDLAVVLSALWVYDLDEYLDFLLTSRRRSSSHPEDTWILVFHAAALLRMNQRHSKGQEILREIEERFTEAQNAKEKATLAVGLAYLFFHLWVGRGGEASWRKHKSSLNPGRSSGLNRIIEAAIKYARHACKNIQEGAKTRAYAINQYLYYLVEGANDDLFREARGIASELLMFKIDRATWQYRYDDTLARYFHRLGRTRESDARAEYFQMAKRFIEEAYQNCCGDPDVLQYQALLVNELSIVGEE